MPPTIILAKPNQADIVSSVLTEAADWLASEGKRLWDNQHVSLHSITADVRAGMYHIAWLNQEAAGVIRLQLEDPEFWPDATEAEAIYIHRLAVRRRLAGGEISNALFHHAVAQARELSRKFVRLDCAADRPRLRAIYERLGFLFRDDRDMGKFIVRNMNLKCTQRDNPRLRCGRTGL